MQADGSPSPALLLKVRSTTKLLYFCTHFSLDGTLLNSM